MEIFKLYGSIMMNTADAEKSIAKTSEKAETLGTELGNGIKTAAKWGTAIVGVASAIGGAMVKSVESTASAMDTIDKASQRMDISAESYQKLAYASELCGVEMSTMEKAAKQLEGTDMNMDDALNSILSIEDATERSNKAIELFGESVAYQMTPLLNEGAEGFAKMTQEAEDLGLVMSEDAVKSGAAMNDSFTKVKESLGAMKNSLMSDLMPYVQKILDFIIENMPLIQETVSSVMDAILPIITNVLDIVMALLPPLMDAIKGLLDWLMPYLKPIIDGVVSFVKGIFGLLNGDVGGFIDGIKKLFTGLGKALFGIGKDIINSLWNGIKNVWASVTQWFNDKIQWVKDKFSFITGKQNAVSNAHASGLAYVPYDGYQATLHRGETVLNPTQAQEYREGTNGNTTVNITVNGAEGQDVKALAQEIMAEIQFATNRKASVFA